MKLGNIKIVALAAIAVVALSGCKSKESLYKKAYEKAQAQTQVAAPQQTQVAVQQPTPVRVAPVQTPQVDVSNEATRSEDLTLIKGTGLKAYSVVVGAFGLQANAEGLSAKLAGSQIALNKARKLYRVIAFTSDSKADAVAKRNALRSQYPDAWLLYNK